MQEDSSKKVETRDEGKDTLLVQLSQQQNGDNPVVVGSEGKPAKAPKDPFANATFVKVAMRLSYNGQKYNGFETCEDKHQTHTQAVEDKLFDALEKVTLIRDRKTIEKECNYAKSGRTDAGVSASYNVISLKVRRVCGRIPVDLDDVKKFPVMLNRSLPLDIRVIDCVEVPDDFNARFDCLSREYMYFFMRKNMNVVKMDEACKLLEGKHDYRNICRLNVVQVENYIRRIVHAGIYPADELMSGYDGWERVPGFKLGQNGGPKVRPALNETGSPFDMFYLRVRATAFLWHQIRCIMTILESVGMGADEPSVVTELLNIEKNPSKPGYKLADPEPLILSHCEYDPCPFGEPHNQTYNSSPYTIFSEQIEKSLSQVCHLRLGLQDLPKSGRVVAQRSILEVQRGKSHNERLENLKGNKKKRWENVQDWKAQILEKEKFTGPPKGRGPERSRSRSQDRYEKHEEVEAAPKKLDTKRGSAEGGEGTD